MKRLWRTLGNIALVLTLVLCVWLMSGAVAYGWLLHADHYGHAFKSFGIFSMIGSGILTVGVILYFCKLDLPALITDLIGWLLLFIIMLMAMHRADINGWSGQTEASFGQTAAEHWRNGMAWDALPAGLLAILTLTRFFSQEAIQKRAEKREARENHRNRPAPSILGDDSNPQESPKKHSK